MKLKPPLFLTLLAVCGAALGMYSAYALETLSISATETALLHGLVGLILACFLAAMAYARSSLLSERPEPPYGWFEVPPKTVTKARGKKREDEPGTEMNPARAAAQPHE